MPNARRTYFTSQRQEELRRVLAALALQPGARSFGEVAEFLRQLPLGRWPELDQRLRNGPTGTDGEDPLVRAWRGLTREQIREWPVAPLTLVACHGNGHLREAALHRLALVTDGRELPAFLLRANDWVDPVRTVALAALRARLQPGSVRHFLELANLVTRLDEGQRSRQEGVFGEIVSFLQKAECRSELRVAAEARNPAARRFALCIGTGLPEAERHEFHRMGLRDPDPVQRLAAARVIVLTASASRLPKLARQLWTDPWSPVRQVGLRLLASHLPPEQAAPLLQEALLDSHAQVRELARFLLRNVSPGFDPPAFYRQSLRDQAGKLLVAAVQGLGETGAATDAELLLEFAGSPLPRLRAAAVAAIGRLDGSAQLDLLYRALVGEERGASRAAAQALLPFAVEVGVGRCTELLAPHQPLLLRRRVFPLVRQLWHWPRLPLLLQLTADPAAPLAAQARAEVARWIAASNRTFVRPSAVELAHVEEALRAWHASIPADAAREIEAQLRTWRDQTRSS